MVNTLHILIGFHLKFENYSRGEKITPEIWNVIEVSLKQQAYIRKSYEKKKWEYSTKISELVIF